MPFLSCEDSSACFARTHRKKERELSHTHTHLQEITKCAIRILQHGDENTSPSSSTNTYNPQWITIRLAQDAPKLKQPSLLLFALIPVHHRTVTILSHPPCFRHSHTQTPGWRSTYDPNVCVATTPDWSKNYTCIITVIHIQLSPYRWRWNDPKVSTMCTRIVHITLGSLTLWSEVVGLQLHFMVIKASIIRVIHIKCHLNIWRWNDPRVSTRVEIIVVHVNCEFWAQLDA